MLSFQSAGVRSLKEGGRSFYHPALESGMIKAIFVVNPLSVG